MIFELTGALKQVEAVFDQRELALYQGLLPSLLHLVDHIARQASDCARIRGACG